MIFSYLLNMQSHPSWVCGLKHSIFIEGNTSVRSHPSWVCGLKPVSPITRLTVGMSHPSWVCGLKLVVFLCGWLRQSVTPFVGVWIETWTISSSCMKIRVTSFVCVWIETPLPYHLFLRLPSHTLRGCVE